MDGARQEPSDLHLRWPGGGVVGGWANSMLASREIEPEPLSAIIFCGKEIVHSRRLAVGHNSGKMKPRYLLFFLFFLQQAKSGQSDRGADNRKNQEQDHSTKGGWEKSR